MMVTHDAGGGRAGEDGAAPGEGDVLVRAPGGDPGGGGHEVLAPRAAPISAGTSGARSSRSPAWRWRCSCSRRSARVVTTSSAAAQFGSARRLVTQNSTGVRPPAAGELRQPAQAVPGMQKVTWANWFGGKYGDGKRFFAPVRGGCRSRTWTCIRRCRCRRTRSRPSSRTRSAALDRRAAARTCSAGRWAQNVTLQGHDLPRRLDLHRSAASTPRPIRSINDDAMMFHYEYLDERTGGTGNAGWYIMEIDEPDNAARSRRRSTISSGTPPRPPRPAPSRRSTRASPRCGATSSLLMSTIGMAVVFAILLVTANAMMMSARERTGESGGAQDDRLLRSAAVRAGAWSRRG